MKTARVRIAIIIDSAGNFSVAGWKTAKDEDMVANANDFFEGSNGVEAVRFIEADVPLPDPESLTVEGKVTQ